MPSNARCWTPPRAALVIATIFLSGCERVDSNRPASVCPPVVDYSRLEQAQVADEIAALPENVSIPHDLAGHSTNTWPPIPWGLGHP